ncbi:IS481 family transposase [Solimicrobium silvestre]|uniref:Integrase core domain n=1 Tax=Solimicrobium silvestre TaxID=2099400 RepID=A0A2S9GS54_9BURK|nr:IS481 family transposase [Solimicrobium silvestre]PRC90552.1 Integrase core domain [Solimicrobium silvestre]
MTWNTANTMDLRLEFIHLALQEGANRRELCRRFGISPKTAYKWLERYAVQGEEGLQDRSRRPHHSPNHSSDHLEKLVVDLRHAHPCWGGRKIRQRLEDLGQNELPHAATVTHILRRHGLITPEASEQHTPWKRFEHEEPNALWQIDFKGNFETLHATCYPLTLLDDHSRFNLILAACARPNHDTVQAALTTTFERYGLPRRINADNGPPWGSPKQPTQSITKLTMWLIRLGIQVSHSQPAHPQTNGKIERFHRTLKAEVLNSNHFNDLPAAQIAFDRWRHIYNMERPHEGIQLRTPMTRYRPSPFTFPRILPPVEYLPGDVVIKVGWEGMFKFQNRPIKVSSALRNELIAIRPIVGMDGVFNVFYCRQKILKIDLRAATNSA